MKKRRREAKRALIEPEEPVETKKAKPAEEPTTHGPQPVDPPPEEEKPATQPDQNTELSEEEKKIMRQREKARQRKEQRKKKKAAKATVEEELNEMRAKEQERARSIKEEKKKMKDKEPEQEEFQTLELGVQSQDVTIGTGTVVKDRSKVRVRYTLRAEHKNGKILDSKTDFEFQVGKGDVIKGWDIGLMGMRQGGVRHLLVPPAAGYGSRNVGAGHGGMLFFEVNLISC